MFFWGIVGYRLLEIKEYEMANPQATSVSTARVQLIANMASKVSHLDARVSRMLRAMDRLAGQLPAATLADPNDAAKLLRSEWRTHHGTSATATPKQRSQQPQKAGAPTRGYAP